MAKQSTRLERLGPRGCAEFWNGAQRDDLFAHIEDDGSLSVSAHHYHPGLLQDWDWEEWEAKQCYLSAKATRENWETLYRIARVLVQFGNVSLYQGDGTIVTISCDGSCVTIQ